MVAHPTHPRTVGRTPGWRHNAGPGLGAGGGGRRPRRPGQRGPPLVGRRRGRHALLHQARRAPVQQGRLQQSLLPRLVPGPGRLPPEPVRLRSGPRLSSSCGRTADGACGSMPTRWTTAWPCASRCGSCPTAAAASSARRPGSTTCSARWIAGGAPFKPNAEPYLAKLEVFPRELRLAEKQAVALRTVAHFSDGSREEVTPLTTFASNNESVAEVSDDGTVTAVGTGDTAVVVSYAGGVITCPVIVPRSTAGAVSRLPRRQPHRRTGGRQAAQGRHPSVRPRAATSSSCGESTST